MSVAISVESDATRLAFERLYQRYVSDVYRYALAVLRDPAEAEDVTQTTFLNAWRAYRAGQTPHKPQNWLLAIAHNACRLRFRTRSRRVSEVELDPERHGGAAPDGPTAADVLEALSELPLNQRSALVMRELEGRSYDEIAEILGVSRAAVETLIFRARRTMRVRHSSLRSALAGIPLPSSLTSFFRDRGIETGAATILGSGVLAKAAAVVAAGVVVATAGSELAESKETVGGRGGAAPAYAAPDRIVAPPAPVAAAPATEHALAPATSAEGPQRQHAAGAAKKPTSAPATAVAVAAPAAGAAAAAPVAAAEEASARAGAPAPVTAPRVETLVSKVEDVVEQVTAAVSVVPVSRVTPPEPSLPVPVPVPSEPEAPSPFAASPPLPAPPDPPSLP